MDVIDLICTGILLLLAVWYCACLEAEKKHFQFEIAIKSLFMITAIGNAGKNTRSFFISWLFVCFEGLCLFFFKLIFYDYIDYDHFLSGISAL